VSLKKEQHMSLPKLYNVAREGNRRMAALEARERPLGPDDLPIERQRDLEDQALATTMLPRSYTQQVGAPGPVPGRASASSAARHRHPPPFLRGIADRLLRHRQTN
jgi:hypothetical protein